MSEWQPIATAPKNEHVLVWIPKHPMDMFGSEGEHVAFAFFELITERGEQSQRRESWVWFIGRDRASAEPTHWMPIPTDPNGVRYR